MYFAEQVLVGAKERLEGRSTSTVGVGVSLSVYTEILSRHFL